MKGGQTVIDVRAPTIIDYGICAAHDHECAVISGEHAVFQYNTAVFYPSWKAQKQGWRLVQAKTWFQRLVLRIAFGET